MLRRIAAGVGLALGAVLLAAVLRHLPNDERQAGVLIGLVAGGLLLNVISMVRHQLDLRAWVRNLACAVGLILLAGTLVTWYALGRRAFVADGKPAIDPQFRISLLQWRDVLLWLSATIGYVVFSLALLPGARRPARPAENAPEQPAGDPGEPSPDA